MDLGTASARTLTSLRGREIGIIVQNPIAALNPTITIGDQLVAAYQAHVRCHKREAYDRALDGLRQVGISDPIRRAQAYPHQLSLGMAQRVLIAMALLHEPKLLIADEPTSGLDVTIQAEVLELIMALVGKKGTSLWLITHDLSVVANYCNRAAVMFGGSIVEQGSVSGMFSMPQHPYTIGLIESNLSGTGTRDRLRIAGPPPDLTSQAPGCCFAYRCPWVEDHCLEMPPALLQVREGTEVRCFVAQRSLSP
jgi:oligopeptide/dipeptide ABC transporter ATP-binding protein